MGTVNTPIAGSIDSDPLLFWYVMVFHCPLPLKSPLIEERIRINALDLISMKEAYIILGILKFNRPKSHIALVDLFINKECDFYVEAIIKNCLFNKNLI